MIDAARNLVQNDLLAALPPEQWKRWQPDLEYADVPLGDVLYEPGDTLTHVYFTTTSIVSLLYVMKNGEPAEIAVVGNDGVVGSRCAAPGPRAFIEVRRAESAERH
jgi:CRP-like cAMP-binding protein